MTSEDNAAEIRSQYFEWFIKKPSDITLVRNLFEDMKKSNPPSLKLYELMIFAESLQTKPKIIAIRQLLIEACEKFGRNEISEQLFIFHLNFMTLIVNCVYRRLESTNTIRVPNSKSNNGKKTHEKVNQVFAIRS